MSKTTKLRVSDNASFLLEGENGFQTRKRTPAEQVIKILAAIGFIGLGTSIIVYYDSLTGVYICGTLGTVLFFVGKQMERVKLMLNVNDFMNALFSSVIAKNYTFTCVAKATGEIIYFNRDFQDIFPDFVAQDNRSLESLLTHSSASEEHKGLALNALASNGEARASVILHAGTDKSARPFALAFEPIARPSGFVLIRGA